MIHDVSIEKTKHTKVYILYNNTNIRKGKRKKSNLLKNQIRKKTFLKLFFSLC